MSTIGSQADSLLTNTYSNTGLRGLVRELDLAAMLARTGQYSMRYGLVVVIGWIGAMKFTAYEAQAISGLVANSPLMAWVYGILSHRQFSAFLGLVELAVAALIALRPYAPRAAAAGAAAAIGMFLTTLSFMVTTPGVFEPAAGGFPALSAMPGQFLVKDVALLGVSIWLLGDALAACADECRARPQHTEPVCTAKCHGN